MRTIATALLGVLMLGAAVEKTDPGVAEFEKRVGEYTKLRQKAEAQAPLAKEVKQKKKAEPVEIAVKKDQLAGAIRELRPEAKQGDIFTPEAQAAIKGILDSQLKGKRNKAARQTTKDGNPAAEAPSAPVPLKVNAKYPDKAPLSTVPPTVLLLLPQLPKGLEYRFVGRHLVLHDADANLIVDFMENAVPEA